MCFGKKAGSLDLAESAMLAGLIRAPSQLAPIRNPEAALRRADAVLGAMGLPYRGDLLAPEP